MSQEDIKQSVHDAFDEDDQDTQKPAPKPGSGNPGLPIASLIFAIAGGVLGGYVSWILSVIAGIVAIVLGVMARKQASPRLGLALAGIVIGALCIISSLALVGIYLFQLKSMGLL